MRSATFERGLIRTLMQVLSQKLMKDDVYKLDDFSTTVKDNHKASCGGVFLRVLCHRMKRSFSCKAY